ncbi:hypothetical protein SBI_07456 [Streptomyces bingchenggensis BCW-1]|uniref:Uncharacterized protein n=1 Tax=Streptomyces bingchenggensis (strain BCW-1) TaxID=749414 RepID=D7C958_STRBB|nr:hypothetical protein SBI_07456 [Streptomyces bingchenggensis BCW-1]
MARLDARPVSTPVPFSGALYPHHPAHSTHAPTRVIR